MCTHIFCLTFWPFEQSLTGTLCTRLLQSQVKQLPFPAWCKEAIVCKYRQCAVRQASTAMVNTGTEQMECGVWYSEGFHNSWRQQNVSYLEADCLLNPPALEMLGMMTCVERSVWLQTWEQPRTSPRCVPVCHNLIGAGQHKCQETEVVLNLWGMYSRRWFAWDSLGKHWLLCLPFLEKWFSEGWGDVSFSHICKWFVLKSILGIAFCICG